MKSQSSLKCPNCCAPYEVHGQVQCNYCKALVPLPEGHDIAFIVELRNTFVEHIYGRY